MEQLGLWHTVRLRLLQEVLDVNLLAACAFPSDGVLRDAAWIDAVHESGGGQSIRGHITNFNQVLHMHYNKCNEIPDACLLSNTEGPCVFYNGPST